MKLTENKENQLKWQSNELNIYLSQIKLKYY